MSSRRPFYLTSVIYLCSICALVFAATKYLFIKSGIEYPRTYLKESPDKLFLNLFRIWRARIIRRVISVLVRSPLRKNVLTLVKLSIDLPTDKGCVIITCHTPWKRVLVQWCMENNFGLIIAAGNWTNKKRYIQRHCTGIGELHELLHYANNKGKIIFAGDTFNTSTDCPVSFLEEKHNLSIVPVRLAKTAGVPIIIAIPVLNGNTVQIKQGPYYDTKMLHEEPICIMKNILAYFESEIKKDPSIWPSYVR